VKNPSEMTNDEVNEAVAVEVMGWPVYKHAEPRSNEPHALVYAGKVLRHTPYEPFIGPDYKVWSPSRDISAAFEVVQAMREKPGPIQTAFCEALAAELHIRKTDFETVGTIWLVFMGQYAVSPLAISVAALRAVGAIK